LLRDDDHGDGDLHPLPALVCHFAGGGGRDGRGGVGHVIVGGVGGVDCGHPLDHDEHVVDDSLGVGVGVGGGNGDCHWQRKEVTPPFSDGDHLGVGRIGVEGHGDRDHLRLYWIESVAMLCCGSYCDTLCLFAAVTPIESATQVVAGRVTLNWNGSRH